jgi:Rne/Rng family ribonuclease
MVSGHPLRLFLAAHGGGRLIALVEDRRVVEYRVDRPETMSRIGEIHLGRVQRVEKTIDAAFVEIGLDRPALLPVAEHDGRLVEGEAVLIQITRDGRDGKGARVTGRPALPGRALVFDPHHPGVSVSQRVADRDAAARLTTAVRALALPGEGFIVRSAALAASPDALAAEAARLRAAWREIETRRAGLKPPACLHREDAIVALLRDAGAAVGEIVVDMRGAADALRPRLEVALPDLAPRLVVRPVRDWVPSADEIDEQVVAALEPEVPLPSGGTLLIEPGRTLTAVDVNSGGGASDPGGRRAGERRFLEANLEAAAEIARQLRLRNIGGIVVIDFIDVKAPQARAQVVDALKAAVADDPAPCWIGPMSRLGLVEMTRRRRGASLAEMLTVACPACDGGGRVRIAGGRFREGGGGGR